MSSPYAGPMAMIPQPLPLQWYCQPCVRPMIVLPQPPSTKVFEGFVSQPMDKLKPVEALAGIGAHYGGKLRAAGYDLAYQVFGKFLELKRDANLFTTWLGGLTLANERHRLACFLCLNEWCNRHFF